MNQHNHIAFSPLAGDPYRWGSVEELSRLLGRPYKTVVAMVLSGAIADYGIRSYQDSMRRWWVLIPDELRQ